MNFFNEASKIVNHLKQQQKSGETPVETIKRLLGANLDEKQMAALDTIEQQMAPQQEPTPTPQPAPAPAIPPTPTYKFKSFEAMNLILALKYGSNWRARMGSGALDRAFGVQPAEPTAQAEMHRIWSAGDNTVGSITVEGKAVSFIKDMIEQI